MYSPRRTANEIHDPIIRSPEGRSIVSSPLRALASPFYKAVKTAQSNASRDFDRFYGNLQARLTPRTSEARIRKHTPDTTDRMRSVLQKRRMESDLDASRTSLTPLIERHTLREDASTGYEYASRNPFYRESVSEIADTPSLSDHDDDTPMTHTSIPQRSSYLQSPSNSKNSLAMFGTLQQKLAEERKRMDKLQSNLSKIRRQSSLLADDLSMFGDEEEEEEGDGDEDVFMAAAPSSKEDIMSALSTRGQSSLTASDRRPSARSLASNRRSSAISELPRVHKDPTSTPINPTTTATTITTNITNTTSPMTPQLREYTASVTSSARRPSASTTTSYKNITSDRIVSPKRKIIHDIGSAHLRSAETIRTPGGSQVSNRFWKEIHGLNARRESESPRSSGGRISKRATPLVKRFSTLRSSSSSNSNKGLSTSQSWANDDAFWSSESTPVSSTLNNKLIQIAKDKGKTNALPVASASRRSLSTRLSEAREAAAAAANAAAEPESLFDNPLFKKAAAQMKELDNSEHVHTCTSSSSRLNSAVNGGNSSLLDEIENARKRDDELKKKHSIPSLNARVLAELKAKHKDKFLDDAGSYKYA